MSVRIITLIGVLLLFVTPLFAYRDSVDYDNGSSGMGFLYFLLAWIVISFIVVIGKKLFK